MLQASWSFQGMQALGFAYAMEPALRRLYGGGEAYRRGVSRHLKFFNTHPFLAAAVLGGAVRVEAEGGDGADEGVRRLKNGLMGPLGAVGDCFYWGALKPLLVLAALHLACRGVLWAPAAFVATFGACNLAGRGYAFVQGYRRGSGVADFLSCWGLLRWARRCQFLAALLLGALLAAAYGPDFLDGWAVPVVAGAGAALTLALGTGWVLARGVRLSWLLWAAAILCWGVVAWT